MIQLKKMILLLIISAFSSSLAAQKNRSPNFIITHQLDTISVAKIDFVDSRWNDLNFTLTHFDNSRERMPGSEVWRFKRTESNKKYFYQVVRIEGKNRINHKVMILALGGRLDVMYNLSRADRFPFISGAGFNDFVTNVHGFKRFKQLLDRCDAFRASFVDKRGRKYKNLLNMVRFYNNFCGDVDQNLLEARSEARLENQTENQLEASPVDMSSCLDLQINETNTVIRDQRELEVAIKKNFKTLNCMKSLPEIDWDRYLLVGNNISSGACGRPDGLDFNYSHAAGSNTLYLDITYYENQNLCRALSQYLYWLLIPKPNEEVEVVTRISTIDNPGN